MVSLDLFQSGDVYLDYPFEEVKFRYEKKTGRSMVDSMGLPKKSIRAQSFTTRPSLAVR